MTHRYPTAPWIVLLALLAAAAAAAASAAETDPRWNDPRRKVAVLVFEGVQIIDFTGPYEVFGQAGFEVFTVSVDGAPLTAAMGLRIDPTHSLESAPRADIVVLPGGSVPHRLNPEDPRLPWIRKVAGESDAVLSVCNGAFFLASAGLLRGQRATTYALMLDHLPHFAEGVTVVRDERVVDNGKILTAGGLSAGIDGALHLVARYLGEPRAREVANNMEYDWRPDGGYVRAKLADTHAQALLDFNPPAPRRISEVYEGDEDRWTLKWRIKWPGSPAEMIEQLRMGARMAGWTSLEETLPAASDRWRFTDAGGKAWLASASVEQVAEGELRLEVSVRRVAGAPADPRSGEAARDGSATP